MPEVFQGKALVNARPTRTGSRQAGPRGRFRLRDSNTGNCFRGSPVQAKGLTWPLTIGHHRHQGVLLSRQKVGPEVTAVTVCRELFRPVTGG